LKNSYKKRKASEENELPKKALSCHYQKREQKVYRNTEPDFSFKIGDIVLFTGDRRK